MTSPSGLVRPRLLFVATEDWYFASHRIPLARAAIDAGFDVAVACRVRDHGTVIRAAGCEVVPFELARASANPVGELAAIRRLIALYRAFRPTLLHHVALKPVVLGSWAARFVPVQGIVNAIAGLGYLATGRSAKARLLRPVLRAALRGAHRHPNVHVIVQNPEDRQQLVDWRIAVASRITLIRGAGVDLERFQPHPEPPGPPTVVLPARMLWAKGVGTFVEAASLLAARRIAGRFVLAGRLDPGNPTAIPEAQLRRWEAEGVVEWWGHREDMDDVLRDASVVCLPSKYGEGVPKALLEAAAAGRPIVTTRIPGCRDVVIDGESGTLVEPDDAAGLAAALEALLADPERRGRYGRRARERAEAEFGEAGVARETVDIYRRMLASSAG
jgi:glycosyltransferase involved in cell wall biosynthesis